jgi:hypothetical protein
MLYNDKQPLENMHRDNFRKVVRNKYADDIKQYST